jgi:hypothetical protein
MARFCICGCGNELVTKSGSPDYSRRIFYSSECRKKDNAQRLRDKRAQIKKKDRCSRCTQPILTPKTWEALRRLAADAGIRI